ARRCISPACRSTSTSSRAPNSDRSRSITTRSRNRWQSKVAGSTGHHVRRLIAHWSRVLHTYLSMVGFSILFFFAATGITLNHQDKMNGEPKVTRFSGHLDAASVAASLGKQIDQTKVVAQLLAAQRI